MVCPKGLWWGFSFWKREEEGIDQPGYLEGIRHLERWKRGGLEEELTREESDVYV